MRKILTSKGVIDINIPENARIGGDGEYYLVCPICTPGRKAEHKNEKKLAVNLNKHPNPWRCNHCEEKGYVLDDNYIASLKVKPILDRIIWNDLSENILKFFSDRKISKATLEHFRIKQTTEPIRQTKHTDPDKINKILITPAVNFPYIRNSMLINIKYRDSRKNFKMVTGASKVFYNIDSIKNSNFCVVVEGEMDVLSYYEAGVTPVVSVPNGAQISDKEREEYAKSGTFNLPEEINMEYLDNCIEDFDHIETIYLATDDDPAGIKLREQLVRRFGKNRCKYILFSKLKKDNGEGCKDANEVLVNLGAYPLKETLNGAISYPIDGVFTAEVFLPDMKRDFIEGRTSGLPTGWKSLDPHFNWMRGWSYMFNGFPSQGKSSVLFNFILANTIMYKWSAGLYLPENYPEKNIVNTMVEILIGNTTNPKFQGRMSWEEAKRAVLKHIKKYIYFLNDEKGFSPEQLREKKELLVKKHGIVMFVADPWLALNHTLRTKFGSVDEYINYELNFEIRQAQNLNLINIIAHHPSTPIKSKDKEYSAPSPFEPIGGQIWYNKIFGMVCIHRRDNTSWQDTFTEFHVQKQKEEKLAGIRTDKDNPVLLKFDRRSNRFYEREDPTDENSEYTICPFDQFTISDDETLNYEF